MNILTFNIEDWFILGEKNNIDQPQWNNLEPRVNINLASILELLSLTPMLIHLVIKECFEADLINLSGFANTQRYTGARMN